MEEPTKNKTPQETESEIEIVFEFPIENEIWRAKYYCKKERFNQYKQNGYKLTLPTSIEERFEKGEEVMEEEIEQAVRDEFNESGNQEEMYKLKGEWNRIKDGFFENLKTLELPIQNKYFIVLTKYGTGGSYNDKKGDTVQINFKNTKNPPLTLAHEIVHLTIEHLIREYKIDHWTKERLVDLIMNKFFPENPKLQRDPPNAEQISEIFNSNFPDIEKIIKDISHYLPQAKTVFQRQ